MSTTVHLPAALLDSVDRRARELGMSRSRYVARALEHALDAETLWSDRFVNALAEARSDQGGRQALGELRRIVAAHRTRKAPPTL